MTEIPSKYRDILAGEFDSRSHKFDMMVSVSKPCKGPYICCIDPIDNSLAPSLNIKHETLEGILEEISIHWKNLTILIVLGGSCGIDIIPIRVPLNVRWAYESDVHYLWRDIDTLNKYIQSPIIYI